ncbi:MAG: J domain-containing protein, partial [Methyloligellaceae bacterium]
MITKLQTVRIEDECRALLGIERTASLEDIRDAFIERARKCHPDLHPRDPIAENKFKAISEAYSVLSGPKLRGRLPKRLTSGEVGGRALAALDWRQAASVPSGEFRVVGFSILIGVCLGSMIYGATVWFDDSPHAAFDLHSQPVAENPANAGRIAANETEPARLSPGDGEVQRGSPKKTFAKTVASVPRKTGPEKAISVPEAGKDAPVPKAKPETPAARTVD